MSRTFKRYIEHYETVWHGVTITISYEPRWLSLADDYGLDTAHLEIEAIAPERAPLPITETGYRSHFTTAHAVAAMGGPVALVRTWLDEEASSPAWQQQAAAARQLTLFFFRVTLRGLVARWPSLAASSGYGCSPSSLSNAENPKSHLANPERQLSRRKKFIEYAEVRIFGELRRL